MADRRVRRGYGITVGVEVAAIVAGAAVLEGTGRARTARPEPPGYRPGARAVISADGGAP
jgi:hypothetical protein